MNRREVIFQVCSQTLPYSGNTMNLIYPLKHSHDEEYALICKSALSPSTSKPKREEQTQMDYFTKDLYIRGSQHFKQCEVLVMEYVCKDMEGLATIESILFL